MSKLVINKGSKISNEQFLSILRENGGLFAKTARAISKKFKIKYSRQSVRDRAERHPEIMKDIAEENLDIAEEGFLSLMKSENEQVKLKACEIYLKCKAKHRGYVERQEITGADGDAIKTQLVSPERYKEPDEWQKQQKK